ncbi:hypothetical protein JCM19294_1149 [Nonlabens tegetincola]|uniref:Uncharacterized protein n=1 Tax=Nonlabens tegetincola TaxID=323273 RepID=A0A090Q1C4_9FLAO|nr:hypothetical protein [Nonlabens tegetincola]GAK96840.1 hypothetical protein JCM19294_1149 [Nonlabens tegetincola]
MYKFLNEKLNQSKGAIVEQMCFIAFEIEKEKKSDMIEQFEEEIPEHICEILGWRKGYDVYGYIEDAIEDNGLIHLMYEEGYQGFLAQVYFPVCSNFKFSQDNPEEVISWECSRSYSWIIDYVYAHTVAELADKISSKSQEYFDKEVKRFKSKNN